MTGKRGKLASNFPPPAEVGCPAREMDRGGRKYRGRQLTWTRRVRAQGLERVWVTGWVVLMVKVTRSCWQHVLAVTLSRQTRLADTWSPRVSHSRVT